jgi:hypothetical protein
MASSLGPYLKYIVFYFSLIFGVPFCIFFAKKFPFIEKLMFFLMIFFTCRMIDINFVSREWYRISTRGFEIGFVDLCTLVIFALVIYRKHTYQIKLLPPGSILYFLYFFFSLVSIINSEVYLFSMFEVLKMIRMYFYFWVIYNYLNTYEQVQLLKRFLPIIFIYIFVLEIKQKYFMGIFQVFGPFPHQNSLVMYLNVFVAIILAYVLLGNTKHTFFWSFIFSIGALGVLITYSRAGLASFVLSSFIILSISVFSEFKLRQAVTITILFFVSTLVIFKSLDTIYERIVTASPDSAKVRISLAKAALNMANDKFFGVGLNNFGVKVNPPYRYADHIEHHPSITEDDIKNGLVETIYLMVAAETGWLNLGILVLWFIFMFSKNFLYYFRDIKAPLAYLNLGLIGGLTSIYAESVLEWVLKQTNNFYQLMLVFALIGVIDKLYKIDILQKIRNNEKVHLITGPKLITHTFNLFLKRVFSFAKST